MTTLPLGLTRGSFLGAPFDPERVYVEERDPALLRQLGVPLSADTYALLAHCDGAGTGNDDKRTQATEVVAQCEGQQRLMPKLRALLLELPRHFEFESIEVEEAMVSSDGVVQREIAIRPGSFEISEEPRLYTGNAKDGVAAPKKLWPAIELILLVIDPEDTRKPKYLDRSEVDQFLSDTHGLTYYRPKQIEAFRAVADLLDQQIEIARGVTLPSLDVPYLGRVEVPALDLKLAANRRLAVTIDLSYELRLTRTGERRGDSVKDVSSALVYARTGSTQMTVPPGYKVILHDESGRRVLGEGTWPIFEKKAETDSEATIEVFNAAGKKVADRCFSIPPVDFEIELSESAMLPVATNGTPALPLLRSLEEPRGKQGGEVIAEWTYGGAIKEDAKKAARARTLFAAPETSLADGRYRVTVGQNTVDFEKYSDSLYRVAIDGRQPQWMIPGEGPQGLADGDRCWVATFQGLVCAFNPRTRELFVGSYNTFANAEVTPREIEREQQIAEDQENVTAIANRLIYVDGNVDPSSAISEMAQMPADLLLALARKGLEATVCDSIVERHPGLAGQHARGTPSFVTWDAAHGYYGWGESVISIAVAGGHAIQPGTLLHQVGHAIDDLGGNLSRSESFRRAYQADLPALKKQDQAFLIQPGDEGIEQAFAASFVWFISDRAQLEGYPALLQYWEDQQGGWRHLT